MVRSRSKAHRAPARFSRFVSRSPRS